MIYGPYLASVEWCNHPIDCVMSDDDRLYFPCAATASDAAQVLSYMAGISALSGEKPAAQFLAGLLVELEAGLPGVVD